MPKSGSYGNPLSVAFRAPDAPSLSTRVLQHSTLAVTELLCDDFGFGRTTPLPREDAWLVALQLRACPNQDLYFDGQLRRAQNHTVGVTSIYDLRRGPVADIREPFHSLVFYLPRTAINSLAAEAGLRPPDDLRHTLGLSVDDPVVRHLLSSLRPLIAAPEQVHPLFLDHVVLAMTAHMACAYGGMKKDAGIPRGGLAPAQERRAKEFMSANLNEAFSLNRLAVECGLSTQHFARAFRLSTGMPPHRFLVRLRLERAKELLRTRALSLVDVAIFSGFADQSHFNRVFKAAVGVTPGTWRSMNTTRTS